MRTILAAAAVATAVQMMPAGPSPEAGFAGLWRIVAAAPAPWAHGAPRTPLLEYAVAFVDGKVTGPAPLGCADARYASGVTYADGLFGGKLQGPDEAVSAKRLHLSSGETSTYRVLCGGAVRDYYFDDAADMVMAEGDVIYTLQRPTGMDPQQYKPGFSGPSFDCTKARTAAETLICTDAGLSKADRELAAAFAKLRASETPESFATVRAAQRGWLAYVLKTCPGKDCLDENYTDRADRLDALSVVKSGPLALEPRMRLFTKPRPATEDSDIYPWMMGGPDAAPFNAWIAKRLALAKRRMDDKDLFPFGDQVADLQLYARRTYTVSRFDAKIASLMVETFDYTGGAHEAIGEETLNWDMVHRRPFGPKDVFKGGWRKFATDYCLKDLAGQQSGSFERDAVDAVVGGDNWLFAKDHARVHFTVYTIASFSGGEFDVDIPYTALRPYLRPDVPIP